VLNMVDAKLFAGELDGFRYAELPDDRETWRRVAVGLDAAARQHGAADFVNATEDVRERVVDALAKGTLHGEVWDALEPAHVWKVVTRAMLSAFYSHPWAWNEIGFGGPAYPRGYARIGAGQRESWEGAEAFERDPVKDTEQRGDQEPDRP
jgi:hypothetical protein